jgi:cellulose synthase operon protein C
VLEHEFVHVLNLQQTDFAVPHWLTEGLAVHLEDQPRPAKWTLLLASRAQDEKLFNLDTLTLGFIRPASSDDWTLAYCQAELYVEYLLQQYGDDAIAKLLAAYADRLSTPDGSGAMLRRRRSKTSKRVTRPIIKSRSPAAGQLVPRVVADAGPASAGR